MRFDFFNSLWDEPVADRNYTYEFVPNTRQFTTKEDDVQILNIQLDLPGVDPKDVDVTVEKNIIRIAGKRHIEKRTFSFRESYRLGTDVLDLSTLSATYDKGVLTIQIRSKPEVMPKKIEIKALE